MEIHYSYIILEMKIEDHYSVVFASKSLYIGDRVKNRALSDMFLENTNTRILIGLFLK